MGRFMEYVGGNVWLKRKLKTTIEIAHRAGCSEPYCPGFWENLELNFWDIVGFGVPRKYIRGPNSE